MNLDQNQGPQAPQPQATPGANQPTSYPKQEAIAQFPMTVIMVTFVAFVVAAYLYDKPSSSGFPQELPLKRLNIPESLEANQWFNSITALRSSLPANFSAKPMTTGTQVTDFTYRDGNHLYIKLMAEQFDSEVDVMDYAKKLVAAKTEAMSATFDEIETVKTKSGQSFYVVNAKKADNDFQYTFKIWTHDEKLIWHVGMIASPDNKEALSARDEFFPKIVDTTVVAH